MSIFETVAIQSSLLVTEFPLHLRPQNKIGNGNFNLKYSETNSESSSSFKLRSKESRGKEDTNDG